ncbi:MAG: DUF5615 family PIN-like protein [Candidatus Micrarchaeota archaeon]|nr:DUF5615 family PIN-like protein [Candidatus Micrarchaeota archaeon]
MRFLIDANVSPHVCEIIRSFGFTATHVFDINLSKDKHILNHAVQKGCILVTRDSDFEQLIDEIEERNNRLPKGLVMIKGEARTDQMITNKNLEKAVRTMLEWLSGCRIDELGYVSIMIDKSGIGYRCIPEGVAIEEPDEVRQVYDLEEKLEYIAVNAARDSYRRNKGLFKAPEVTLISILDEHRNIIRENLGFIMERVDCAMKAGVEISKFGMLNKVVFTNDLDYVKWLRGFASHEALESEEFQKIEKRAKDRVPRSTL